MKQKDNCMRIGHGYDVHKFGGEGPLMLGGISIPYKQGFVAHSDGDVAIHALCELCWVLYAWRISVIIFLIQMVNIKISLAVFCFVMWFH